MRLRYSPSALADLEQILAYIAERSPQRAHKVQARIQAIMNLLVRYPMIGTQTDDRTIRRMTASPYPYLIFYEPTDDEVIRAVRHAARKPVDVTE
jgi:toxin ParE1/3/4